MRPAATCLDNESDMTIINALRGSRSTPWSTHSESPICSIQNTTMPSLCAESQHLYEPIAIVGLSMRLPGGVHSTEDFWEMLVNQKDGRCPVPASRYNVNGFFDSSNSPVSGHFLQEDPACFDAGFFSISPQEARRLDPQQRQLMEVVWECLENAGETRWQGADIGLYVGTFGDDWLEVSLRSGLRADRYQLLGGSRVCTVQPCLL